MAMEDFTFHNIKVTVRSDSPENAYKFLSDILWCNNHTTNVEFDCYTEEGSDEIFPVHVSK